MAYLIRTAYKASSAPLRPVNFTAVLGTDPKTEVDMEWIEPFPADALVGYRIQRDGVEIVDLPKGTLTYTETGLTPGAQHSYTITSYSQSSESRPTQPPQVVTLEADIGFFIAGENQQRELGVNQSPIREFIQHPLVPEAVFVHAGDSENTFYIAPDRTLYGNGKNDLGILGLGFQGNPGNAQYEFIMAGVARVISDLNGAFFLATNGNLYRTGGGFNGDGTSLSVVFTPTLIASNVIDMATWNNGSEAGAFYIDINNDMYTVGTGRGVGLGLGFGGEELTWTLVLSNVKSVSAGLHASFAVLNDNTLWWCGANSDGSLGSGGTAAEGEFILIETGVNSVSHHATHTLMVTTSNDLYATGSNGVGELGFGAIGPSVNTFQFVRPNIATVETGFQASGAIGTDTSLLVWGSNDNWQLGVDNGSPFVGDDIIVPLFIAFQVTQFTTSIFGCQMIVAA